MPTYANLLSENTVRLTTGVGGWVASNGSIQRTKGASLYPTTIGGTSHYNALKVTTTAGGDTELITESITCEAGETYSVSVWVGQGINPRSCWVGLRYYDQHNALLETTLHKYSGQPNKWIMVLGGGEAPDDAASMVPYLTIKNTNAGDTHYVSWPSVLHQGAFGSLNLGYTLSRIPEYILEEDAAIDGVSGRPLLRYLNMATGQIQDISNAILDWRYYRATDVIGGQEHLSALVDPDTVDEDYLTWLAQLLGVQRFRSEDLGDLEDSFRSQVKWAATGLAAGTSRAIRGVVEDHLTGSSVYSRVLKHYRTNPWFFMVAFRGTDPDPGGTALRDLVQAAAPAGMMAFTEEGLWYSSSAFFDPTIYYDNIGVAASAGAVVSDTRLIEDEMGTGRHIRLGDLTSVADPPLGGEVALARYFQGHALYSGGVEATTASAAALDITGDFAVQALISDVTLPASGSRWLVGVPNKWGVYLKSTGEATLEWYDSSHVQNTRDSTVALDLSSPYPFWLRAILDVDNGASGHTVRFDTAPTIYDDWTMVGASVTTAVATDVDSNPAGIQILSKDTDPVDGLSCVVYRVMLWSYLGLTSPSSVSGMAYVPSPVIRGGDKIIVSPISLPSSISLSTFGSDVTQLPSSSTLPFLDVNFLDTSNSNIYTGTSFFVESTNNVVTVDGASYGETNFALSRWVFMPHDGSNDYFHFGSVASGDGDELMVSGMASADHDYKVFYLDGTDSGSVNAGTGTSITFNATNSNVEGKSITKIEAYGVGTTTPVLARFDVDDFFWTTTKGSTYVPAQVSKADPVDGGVTWTLTRLWDTGDEYEYSGHVNRNLFKFKEGVGRFDSDIEFGGETPFTAVLAARRYWAASGTTTLVNHLLSTGGWKISYDGNNIVALVTNFTNTVTLTWDEAAAGRLGKVNLIVLRRDVAEERIELIANGIVVDWAVDTLVGE